MNGKPLDRESPEMLAMVAYMKWLSQATPKNQKVDISNAGEGIKDSRGDIIFPPLWGDESFNIGAGVARTYKAAAFVKYNMPMGIQTKGLWGHGNVLSDQDARY